jgi:hypothetical protein
MGLLRNLLSLPVQAVRSLISAISSPGRFFGSGQRLFGLSLPARVSIIVAVLLVIGVVVHLLLAQFTEHRYFKPLVHNPKYLAGTIVLVVLIPVVVYYMVKYWLEGEVSPYQEIDLAWRAGLGELERHGIDITLTPLYLVLGTLGVEQEKAIFDACRMSLNLSGVPQGPAALHWYANRDVIYLVASETSALSYLVANASDAAAAGAAAGLEPDSPGGSIRTTMVVGGESAPPDVRGTAGAPATPAEPWNENRGSADIYGTMVVSAVPETSNPPKRGGGRVRKLDFDSKRLEYVCHLLGRSRRPICPLNGILALLPFSLIHESDDAAVSVNQALQQDLHSILKVGNLRCPATAVVIGLEEESGFRELLRRVGRDKAMNSRFGKGFDLPNFPLPERIGALVRQACGAFETWVYALFKERDALKRQGNRQLYALLCKIRQDVYPRLDKILVDGFASDPERKDSNDQPLFFRGCYFAATGATEDRQAFIKSVFEDLPRNFAGDLQWTREALERDAWHRRLAGVAGWLDFLLILALVAILLGWKFVFPK